MAPGGGRDFNCSWEQCGKSFNRKSDLCRHYRIHTNERPYHCTHENCNKSFIQRSALTVHSRTHTGEKPHVCDHDGCHKAFSDSSSLARHRRIHTGKRPYICNEPACERSFCRKTTLTKHQHRSHHSRSTRLSSEEIIPEENTPYQPSVATKTSSISSSSPLSSSAPSATPLTSNQYLLTQQPYYQPATPNNEYFPSQHGMPLPQVPGQEPQAIQPHQIAPPPSISMQYTTAIQQRYDTISRSPYLPPEYHQLPPYPVHHIPSDGHHPIMVTYPQDYPYKSSPRLMSQHEGTDWGFLGVS